MGKTFLGPDGWKSTYSRDEGIIFDRQPTAEWQYMATGTGRVGIAVIATDPLVLQINHESSFDERGFLTYIARLTLKMDGYPLTQADANRSFKMRHDLRTSRIIISTTDTELTIFAENESGIIAVEWHDMREEKLGGSLSISLPYVADVEKTDDTISMWHDNGENTVWHEINVHSGLENDSSFEDVLKNRKFGLSVRTEDENMQGNGWKITPKEFHRFYICADSGKNAFADKVASDAIRTAEWNVLLNKHTAHFEQFWSRARFECDDERMDYFTMAYDLYRYFTAVSCGKDREFPTRFQIPLLAPRTETVQWGTMQISSIQTLQAYFGIFRNGDFDLLNSLSKRYRKNLEFYKAFTKALTGVDGITIPYETNVWGSFHFYHRSNDYTPSENWCYNEYALYYIPEHIYSVYSHEHGFALMCFLWDAARASGREEEFADWALEMLTEILAFFKNRYMQSDGSLIFDPATSGETWYNCKNPASWIALFIVRLPQVMDFAARFGNTALFTLAEEIYSGLPKIPTGKWQLNVTAGELLPCNDGEEVILPAEDFSRHDAINRENPELYAIWPYGLYGADKPEYDLALRSFEGRAWKRINSGWHLDGIWAACLGMTDEAYSLAKEQIQNTIRCPGGFSYEEAPADPTVPYLPYYPSMQGMGNTVCALYEMLCHDNGNELLILPAWPKDISVSAVIYTASGGRTEIRHRANGETVCETEFAVDKKFM